MVITSNVIDKNTLSQAANVYKKRGRNVTQLTEAVAASSFPLAEIPLMESIAVQSLGAYFGRLEGAGL